MIRAMPVLQVHPLLADQVVVRDQDAVERREHLAIIAALERRDVNAAVAAIGHHYRNTLRWRGVAT